MFLAIALMFAFPWRAAFAQYDNGGLVGTVHDSSGAAVPNVTVTVTNDATGVATVVKTSETGDYELPSLRVGVYTISASAPGYAIAEAKQITVSIGARVRIDLVLKVGAAQATTVEVSDVALQLQTESSQRDQTITNYQTAALPLVSRNYSDLVDYVTGARPDPSQANQTGVTSLLRQGSYSVNGQRSMFNDYMIDGMDNNSYGESNQGFDNQIIQPPPDSVAQFDVVTNNESAEYGRSSGATVNVATKSGANQFHTTLYEFNRNTDLNATGYFAPVKKPGFNRNQFGANFGGPILKNRFFWFVDYEGFRQQLTPLVVLTVPTTAELTGSLAVAVQDPWSPGTYIAKGTPFTSWPSQALADLDPASKAIVADYQAALTQLPSQCTVAVGTGTGGSAGEAASDCPTNAPFTDNADKGDLRLDFQQSQNTSWFLKVSDRKETGDNHPTLPEPIDGQANGEIKIHDEQIALGFNHAMGTNKYLDARLAVSGTTAGKWSKAIGSSYNFASLIPGLPTIANVSGGLPSMAISGGFTSFGRQSTNPQWQNPSLVDPKINYSWVSGRHSLKFGYEYERVWQEIEDSNPLYGSFAFSYGYSVCPASAGSNCPNTSNATDTYWADFLFGASRTYSLATYYITHVYQAMDSAYAQDDWKVMQNLTLNLGLRWEYGSPWWEKDNLISNFNPSTGTLQTLTPGYTTAQSPLCGTAACITPYSGNGVFGKSLVNPDLSDWAPRIGFAYAPTSSIAVRGGYGSAYVHYWRAGSGNNIAINAPFAMITTVTNPNAVSTSGYYKLSKGFPTGLASTFSAGTDNIDSIPPSTKDGYAESWFLSVQKTLAKNILLDIAYVGNHGVHLQGFVNANQKNPANGFARPYPNWGGYLLNNSTLYPTYANGDITEALSEFHSSYNGLQVRYEQRSVGGLTLLNSFSWQHALDNASSTLDANTPCPQNGDNIEADYGQSDYNLPIANVTTLVYELPFGQGKQFLNTANGFVNEVLGGWQISGVNTMQAGTPFNLQYSPAAANAVSPQLSQNWRGFAAYRPNLTAGTQYIQGKVKNSSGYFQYVNLASLNLPSTYVNNIAADGLSSPFGSLPKNYGRTPAFYETDLAFNKRFNTPVERVKIEFRSEFYNIFNHTNLYLPGGTGGGTVTGTNGGAVTGGSGGTITTTFEPRIIQFGLKVTY
ncbi:MAG: TonB-dependent receptor domain-containing protein [Terracidiphilus sp.]